MWLCDRRASKEESQSALARVGSRALLRAGDAMGCGTSSMDYPENPYEGQAAIDPAYLWPFLTESIEL